MQLIPEKLKILRYKPTTIEDYFRKKGCIIGRENRLFIKTLGSEPYLIKIGNHCTISSGVQFITHDGGSCVFRKDIPNLNVFGKIVIGDNCFIGLNSIILPNVKIGNNVVIGAGSVVTRSIPDNVVVAGVPARILSDLEVYKKKCLSAWTKLDLKGERKDWESQLKAHFLNEDNSKEMEHGATFNG